jgi:hypothetical protein
MNDLFWGGCVTVIAAIDVEAGAIEMREGWHQAEALGGGGGNETVEFRHPRA